MREALAHLAPRDLLRGSERGSSAFPELPDVALAPAVEHRHIGLVHVQPQGSAPAALCLVVQGVGPGAKKCARRQKILLCNPMKSLALIG